VKEDDDQGESNVESAVAANLRRGDTKKKRKKKTRKKSLRDVTKSSEDQEELDEVERSVREVNRIMGGTAADAADNVRRGSANEKRQASWTHPLRSLLAVEVRALNPEAEMKRIFGSRVVNAEAAALAAANHHRPHHHRRGGGGGRTRAPRASGASMLVPKANWPNPGRLGGK